MFTFEWELLTGSLCAVFARHFAVGGIAGIFKGTPYRFTLFRRIMTLCLLLTSLLLQE